MFARATGRKEKCCSVMEVFSSSGNDRAPCLCRIGLYINDLPHASISTDRERDFLATQNVFQEMKHIWLDCDPVSCLISRET